MSHSLFGQGKRDSYSIAPPPAWVQRHPLPTLLPHTTNKSDGVIYLLLDQQIDLESETVFYRQVKKVTSEHGVQNESQLEFSFEPSHQALVLHEISIRRNGRRIDRLKPESLRVIQQERDSYRHIYNGEVSVHAVLDDIRMGDEIEFSYSVRGFNPIFEKRFSDSSLIQFSVSVLENRFRIISSKERPPLNFRIFGLPTPVMPAKTGPFESDWVFRNLTPINPEDSLPDWFSPFPRLQFSEYQSWSEVRDWALRHFEPSIRLSAEALELVDRLKREHTTVEARALAALKFVQEEIRYLGIEIGANSHKPHDAPVVFSRRFGDCKDKTVLLLALLRGFGIEAHAALVNTYRGDTISELLPSPLAFNHVIVHAAINGATYWLDPTLTHQRGRLADVSVDDYRKALVLAEEETDFVSIPLKDNFEAAKIVNEKLRIHEYGGRADLEVETIYKGERADAMRRYTSTTSGEDIQKDYLNYYLGIYSGVTNTEPLKVTDDPDENMVITLEKYSIQKLWDTPEKPGEEYNAFFEGSAITEAAARPRISEREMPLGLNFPTHVRHVISIDFPKPGEFPDESKTIADQFQKFVYTGKHAGTNLLLTFDYKTLKDFVPVTNVAEYLKNLDEIHDTCSYGALFPQESTSATSRGMHLPIMVIAAMTLVMLGFGAFKAYQWNPASVVSTVPPVLIAPKLNGLRGWLILVGFGICMSPVGLVRGISEGLPAYTSESWRYLTDPSSAAYHWLYAPMLIGELIGNLALLVIVLLVGILFFQKRRSFPRIYIVFLFLNLCIQFADIAVMRAIPDLAKDLTPSDYRGAFRALFAAIIWTLYMQNSKRVKATFIR